MSYDIYIRDPKDGKTIQLEDKHDIAGGTYCVGGTTEAWLNITYNYAKFFRDVLDEEQGIRMLYGKTGHECIPILEAAIERLGTNTSPDYWQPTSGNAGAALANLLRLVRLCPDGIVSGD